MSFDALFDGSDAHLLPDDFETFWHTRPFGWAACDAKTLAKKVWDEASKLEREDCAKMLEAQRYMTLQPLKTYTADEARRAVRDSVKSLAARIRARSNAEAEGPERR